MKKSAIYLSLLMPLAVALAGCNGEYAQPPLDPIAEDGGEVDANAGTGAWDEPYTVTQVLNGTVAADSWFTGYIVGWIDTAGGTNNVCDATTCTFTVPATLASNMLMAANPDETDWTKCIPVQLVSGSAVRSALNLVDNPGMLGQEVTLYANVEKYFGMAAALKNASAYVLGSVGEDLNSGAGAEPVYSATFLDSSYGGFKLEGELPVDEDGNTVGIWTLSNSYGLVAKALVGGVKYPSDSWAVSPAISLKDVDQPYVSFDWAGNYFTNQANFESCVQLAAREAGATEWTLLEGVTQPAGNSFTYVNTGKVSLEQWAGKKVQIGIRYISSEVLTGTLEIKNFIVDGEAK